MKRKLTHRRRNSSDLVFDVDNCLSCHNVRATSHVTTMASEYMCPNCDIVFKDGNCARCWITPNYSETIYDGQANGDTLPSVRVTDIPLARRLGELDHCSSVQTITDRNQLHDAIYSAPKGATPTYILPSGDGIANDGCAYFETWRPGSKLYDVTSAHSIIPATLCMERETRNTGTGPDEGSLPSSLETDPASSNDRRCLSDTGLHDPVPMFNAKGNDHPFPATRRRRRQTELRENSFSKSDTGLCCQY